MAKLIIKESELSNLVNEVVHKTIRQICLYDINEVRERRKDGMEQRDFIEEKENVKNLIRRCQMFEKELIGSNKSQWQIRVDTGNKQRDNDFDINCHVILQIPDIRIAVNSKLIINHAPLLVPVKLIMFTREFPRTDIFKDSFFEYYIDKIDLRRFDFNIDNFVKNIESKIEYVLPKFIRRNVVNCYKDTLIKNMRLLHSPWKKHRFKYETNY